MSNTATYIGSAKDMSGDARLYFVDPPHFAHDGRSHEFVISSAVDNGWARETYLFPADGDGYVIDWIEMPGSVKGTVDPEYPLLQLGYTIV